MNRLIHFLQNHIPILKLKKGTTHYQNLVFGGGGVKGIAYAGATKALEDANVLQGIERVAGTSAGAFVANLVCLHYNAKEIHDIIMGGDYASFEQGWNPFRITTRYGLYHGNIFLKWVQKTISEKGLSTEATFRDYQKAGCRELHVFATDLNIQNVKCFSVRTTPEVVVAEAIRASMSIPLFFEAWQFSGKNPDDHIYVDGGTIYNYPITAFDNPHPNWETLGFQLNNLNGEIKENPLQFNHPLDYAKTLFNTLMGAQDIHYNGSDTNSKRTVSIDDYGISATDFQLSEADKKKLFDSGIYYTAQHLTGKK